MHNKEPEFMRELHLIRARLAKKWKKMSDREFLSHMRRVGEKAARSFAKDTTPFPSSRL